MKAKRRAGGLRGSGIDPFCRALKTTKSKDPRLAKVFSKLRTNAHFLPGSGSTNQTFLVIIKLAIKTPCFGAKETETDREIGSISYYPDQRSVRPQLAVHVSRSPALPVWHLNPAAHELPRRPRSSPNLLHNLMIEGIPRIDMN